MCCQSERCAGVDLGARHITRENIYIERPLEAGDRPPPPPSLSTRPSSNLFAMILQIRFFAYKTVASYVQTDFCIALFEGKGTKTLTSTVLTGYGLFRQLFVYSQVNNGFWYSLDYVQDLYSQMNNGSWYSLDHVQMNNGSWYSLDHVQDLT